jgi:hypothetical protein
MANEANQGQQSGGQQQKDNPSGQQQPGQKKPDQGTEQQRRAPSQEQGVKRRSVAIDLTDKRTEG